MTLKLILGIVRKSPGPDPEASIELQKERISKRIQEDVDKGLITAAQIVWAVDVCSGDDEKGRVNLKKELDHIQDYQRAYCLNADRFSRSWLGLKWLHEYFINNIQLQFIEGCPNLYNEKGNLREDSYLFFFIQCGFAQWELLRIRSRAQAGRDKLTPKQMKEKYRGRPKGAKDTKKRSIIGYVNRWNKLEDVMK